MVLVLSALSCYIQYTDAGELDKLGLATHHHLSKPDSSMSASEITHDRGSIIIDSLSLKAFQFFPDHDNWINLRNTLPDENTPESEGQRSGNDQNSREELPRHSPPPNGGSTAWLVILGSFLLNFNTFGNLASFGAYQDYYATGELFQASSSQISWIGSVQACLLLIVSALIGPVYDMGHLRLLLAIGSVIVVFGQMMTSLATHYWTVLVAQGVLIGIGSGFVYVPSIAIISQWFSTRNGLAVGIATSGSGLAGTLYSIMFYRLQSSVGFAWATRIIGFVQLATFVVPNWTVRMRIKPPKVRAMVDLSAFREPAWIFFTAGDFVVLLGLFVPYFYVQ